MTKELLLFRYMERSKSKVLIIDDDATYLEETSALLEEAGYQVQTCQNVSQSLRRMREYQPDCLLLDVKMPDLDGKRLLPWIRRQCPHLAVIICTGLEKVEDWYFSMFGVRQILYKPFTHDNLFRAIDHAVELQSQPKPAAG